MTRFTNLVTRHDSDTVTTENIPQSDGSVGWSGRYIVRIRMKLYTLEYRHVRILIKRTNAKNRSARLNSVRWMLLKRVRLKRVLSCNEYILERQNHWHQCWKSSVMTSNRLQRAVFLCMILLAVREPSLLTTYIDISEVASEYSDWLRMICRPQSCGSIVASGEKIVAMGAARKWWTYNSLTSIRQQCLDKSKSLSMIYLPEFNIPHRVVVSFVTY